MKAMILAAGRGERLRPLTDNTPKPLLKVGEHRLIEWQILRLAQAGFKDIVINVSYLAEQIIQRLGDGSQFKVNIQYSDEGKEALESGGGIHHALPLLGEQPFLVTNSDIITDFDYRSLFKFNTHHAHLVFVNNPTHNKDGDFGLVNEHQVIEPQGAKKTYTFAGIAVYHPSFFANCSRDKFPLKPLFDQAIAQDVLTGQLHEGQWLDVGTAERLEVGRKLVAKI